MALYREELASLQEGMASLSSQQQEVLLLRFAEGLRCKDIAARLSKTEGAIRTLLSRTLNHLRGIYKQKEGETNHE
jgi:RNA polymerase sigma-70 factor (ECF subfamily)